MNYNDIVYFLEVATTLNMSRAAEHLGITQPSLSVSIKKLEQAVGSTLFNREKSGLTLTASGKKFHQKARKFQEDWLDLKQYAKCAETEIAGQVKIGCHPSLSIRFLPSQLASLLAEHKNLSIKICSGLSRNISTMILDREVDVGIVVNPVFHPDMIVRKLKNDLFSCFISNKTNKKNCFSKQTVICDPALSQTKSILKQLKDNKVPVNRLIECAEFDTIAALAEEQIGIAILPTGFVNILSNTSLMHWQKTVVHRDTIYLIYRQENRQVQAVQAVVKALKASCR